MAGCRLGTGRSAMFTDGPVFGQSCHPRVEPTASGMDGLPDIGRKPWREAAFWFPEGHDHLADESVWNCLHST